MSEDEFSDMISGTSVKPGITRRELITRGAIGVASIASLGSLAGFLEACGGNSSSPATSGAVSSSTPKRGGSITFAFQEEPGTLDPAVCWDIVGTQIVLNVYRGVLQFPPTPGAAGLILAPDIATQVPSVANGGITNGGKTIIFHLRQGVMFQPPVSREVTADDFKYSFERMLRVPTAPGTYFYMGVVGAQAYMNNKADTVAGFKVIDRYTFEIDLMEPDLSFLDAYGGLNFNYAIPKEWVDKWGNQVNRHPLGSGPFMFDHWNPGQEVVLKRNPNYWEKGKPYLDQLVYKFSISPQTAFLQVQRGEVDVLGDFVPTSDLALANANPALRRNMTSQLEMGTVYLYLDTKVKPLDNVKVRQAISWAIDRDKLVKLLGGDAEPLWQFYPQLMPGYIAGKKFYGYDPAKAKALLAAAGYPNGFKTTIYTENDGSVPMIMQSVQGDLAAVGITAGLKSMSQATYYQIRSTPGATPMGYQLWFMDFPDPIDWILPFATKSDATSGHGHGSLWWSPQCEQMITEAQAMTDPAKRYAKFQQIQDVIMAAAPYVTLYQPKVTELVSDSVGGFFLQVANIWSPISYWRK